MPETQWYYLGPDREKAGPVSEEQLSELVTKGVVSGETLVWHSGMAGWVALAGAVKDAAVPRKPQGPNILTQMQTDRDAAATVRQSEVFKTISVSGFWGKIAMAVLLIVAIAFGIHKFKARGSIGALAPADKPANMTPEK